MKVQRRLKEHYGGEPDHLKGRVDGAGDAAVDYRAYEEAKYYQKGLIKLCICTK